MILSTNELLSFVTTLGETISTDTGPSSAVNELADMSSHDSVQGCGSSLYHQENIRNLDRKAGRVHMESTPHTASMKFASGLVNNSGLLPLATIPEQSSYSVLDVREGSRNSEQDMLVREPKNIPQDDQNVARRHGQNYIQALGPDQTSNETIDPLLPIENLRFFSPAPTTQKCDSEMLFLSAEEATTHFNTVYSQTQFLPTHFSQVEFHDMMGNDGSFNSPLAMVESRHIDRLQEIFADAKESPRNTNTILSDCSVGGSSRSASRCSTSYSGPVLGVDLDLCYDFSGSFIRKRSATPVTCDRPAQCTSQAWCQRSPTRYAKSQEDLSAGSGSILITSSALSSLLPIAAVSGIVRPDSHSSKPSFYSPSGNLIQSTGSSISPKHASRRHASYLVSTRNSEEASAAQGTDHKTVFQHSARSSLAPLDTLAASSAALPSHVRHHYRCRKPEQPEVAPHGTALEETTTIQGCGGIVRTKNPLMCNEPHQAPSDLKSSKKHKKVQSVCFSASAVRSNLGTYRARIRAMAASDCALSCKTERGQNSNTHYTGCRTHIKEDDELFTEKTPSECQKNGEYVKSAWGSLVAYALRVCFCQPYDGAGKETLVFGSSAICFGTKSPNQLSNNRNVSPHTTPHRARVKSIHFTDRGGDRARIPRIENNKVQRIERNRVK